MTDLIKIVNEEVSLGEIINHAAVLTFELHEPVFIGGRLTEEADFELVAINSYNMPYLTAFKIKLIDSGDESIKLAKERAARFVNYLSLRSGKNVRHKYPVIRKLIAPQPGVVNLVPGQAITPPIFDIDIARLGPVLNSDSELNKRLNNYKLGLAAYNDNNFEQAAQSFHQVIEGTGSTEEVEFAPLRHAVSHFKLDNVLTVGELQNRFGLSCQVGSYVNFSDPDNFAKLEFHTARLKAVVDSYLTAELARINL